MTTTDLSIIPVNFETFATRDEWLAARQSYGIGSSDVSAILGLSRYQSALSLYHEKLGLKTESEESREQREWGLILEEPIAQRYALKTGRAVYNPSADGAWKIARSKERPFMLATVDRIVNNPTLIPDAFGVLEIKNAHLFMADEWGPDNNNEPPVEYQVQLQHQLAVTGLQWGSIAALIGGSMFVWADLRRDEVLIARLIDIETGFMRRLEQHDPPPADGSKSTKDILRRLYPRDTGEVIELPIDALEWHQELTAASADEKAAKDRKETASNRLKQAIGDATAGIIPGGITYTYKSQKRAEFISKETEFRVLRQRKK